MKKFYATSKHYSTVSYWDKLQATTLHAAKIEASRRFGNGYHGHVIHLIEVDQEFEKSMSETFGGFSCNDVPAWTKVIPSGKWKQPY